METHEQWKLKDFLYYCACTFLNDKKIVIIRNKIIIKDTITIYIVMKSM